MKSELTNVLSGDDSNKEANKKKKTQQKKKVSIKWFHE